MSRRSGSFVLQSDFVPKGDQVQAIDRLVEGLGAGARHQVLKGVTGSGKTFTMANIIARVDRPVLVISHNKTLAAQLYSEFKGFFPHNAVEYFVSYFDYYQPEAYIPRTDTFIEKDSSINDEIERLRLSAMSSLFGRRDVVVDALREVGGELGDKAVEVRLRGLEELRGLFARDRAIDDEEECLEIFRCRCPRRYRLALYLVAHSLTP